jgi:succinyl-diaminopimelate desuccinylase
MAEWSSSRFWPVFRGLLTIPSTAERPEDLHRALEFVLDVVGPSFTVAQFES